MKHPGLTIFVVFFAISLLDAVGGGHWARTIFWILVGVAFWWLDHRRGHKHPRPT